MAHFMQRRTEGKREVVWEGKAFIHIFQFIFYQKQRKLRQERCDARPFLLSLLFQCFYSVILHHLLSLSYSVTSCLVCRMRCFGPGHCASSCLDASATHVLVTSFIESFGTSHDLRSDPLWRPCDTLPMPKSQACVYVPAPCCL